MVIQNIVISLSRKMLKRVGESKHPCFTQVDIWNQFSIVKDGTDGFIVELFYDAYQVVSDVVLPHVHMDYLLVTLKIFYT